MQARYYDPVIGRFYSNDPVGFTNIHTFNRYGYGNNNPYKYTDPDGRETNPVNSASGITDDQLRTNSFNPNVGKQGYTRSKNNWNGGYHSGVDIKAPKGSGLVAPISGTVRINTEENNPKGGNVVFITRTEGDTTTVVGMAHLDSISVKNGSTVNEGDIIGTAGTSGNAKDMNKEEEHVHMSVRVNGKIVDPQKHFDENPSRIKDK